MLTFQIAEQFPIRENTTKTGACKQMEGGRVLLFWGLLLSVSLVCTAIDTIITNQSISDGDTLVSAGGSFRLGFFSPGDSKRRYLAIWYNNIATQTVVWVANRETPLNDTKGMLKVTRDGLLVILNGTDTIIWSSKSSKFTSNPVVQLMESGNLVLRDGNDNSPDHFFWQSFDHPCETLLPGMKLGIDRLKNQDVYLSSWKTGDDPAHGNFKFQLNSSGYPQIYITNGSIIMFRLGPWNGVGFNGMPSLKPNPFFTYGFVFTKEETYYSYDLISTSVVTRLVLNPAGVMQRFVWINRTRGWLLYTNTQTDNCDTYGLCGAYGSCNIANSPACGCLKGFVPKYAAEWGVADWSNGCVRKTQLDCGEKDGFITYSNVKLPDTQKAWFNDSMNLEECKTLCAKNCTCTAYSNMDVRNGGIGCFLWFGDLLDIREYTKDGQNLYVKMASSELGQISAKKQRGKIIAISVSLTGVLVLATGMVLYLRERKKQRVTTKGNQSKNFKLGPANESQKEDLALQFFDLETIAYATNNFSQENEIGRGGFGPVYKGVLPDGREVAIKKLSEESEQGNNEFDNEVMYIARLQHRNLVKLLGYCQQGTEKMLIYEYLKNRSLDIFLFGRTQERLLLDWSKRFLIIRGIARGLLYLHQDSRLRIVHRDLKAGNILLDSEMNPKISDFGTARSFRGSETEANTRNVVGTHGYISPEYAMDGLFSVKSDVFSFGVLVLEIISGMTNRRSPNQQNRLSLVGHAWKLFQEGKSNELIEASIESSGNLVEVLRCVHVGLLCVQQCAQDRPNMASVILMLEGESAALPQPEQPGFYTERNLLLEAAIADSSSSKPEGCSINMVTITHEEGR